MLIILSYNAIFGRQLSATASAAAVVVVVIGSTNGRNRGKRRGRPAKCHGSAAPGRVRDAGIVGREFDAHGFPDVADRAVVPGVRRLRDRYGRTEHAEHAEPERWRPNTSETAQDRDRQPECQTTFEAYDRGRLRSA